ncbi:hypothetical protein KKC04_04510 [Patescibacteria group bacterium]|nr:hypothetical protein [Patescibacteria group bacterium]
MDNIKKLEFSLQIFVVVAVIFVLFGWSITGLIDFFVMIFTSLVFSVIVGRFLEAFTGDFLKKYGWTMKIFGFKISISLFLVGVILLKIFFL